MGSRSGLELMGVLEESLVASRKPLGKGSSVASRQPSGKSKAKAKSETPSDMEMSTVANDVVIEIWAGAATGRRRMTGKRLGEIAEAAFVAKAAELGFSVAKPWGDSDPYDFITQSGGRLCRVQVKSAHKKGKQGGYSFRAHNHALRAYRANEIDALVAHVVPEKVWYVLPVKVVKGLRSLKLYPGSKRRRSKYEKYREAWGELREAVVSR